MNDDANNCIIATFIYQMSSGNKYFLFLHVSDSSIIIYLFLLQHVFLSFKFSSLF